MLLREKIAQGKKMLRERHETGKNPKGKNTKGKYLLLETKSPWKNMPKQWYQQSLARPSVPSCKPLDRIDAVSHDQQTPLQTHVAIPWDSAGKTAIFQCWTQVCETQTEPVPETSRMADVACGNLAEPQTCADFPQGLNMFQLNLSNFTYWKTPLP